ncbi:hypothetical protein [Kiloniella sp.]|uniref:hypothetical protein n=1 Tax=Kiloniella sp. TaxID=1938587 RepID=UPI003B028592
MLYRSKIILLLVIAWIYPLALNASDNQDPIILYTHIHPPYQFLEGSELQGVGVSTLRCILDRLKRKYTVVVSPPNRNRHLLNVDQADGIFLSVPDPVLNSVAVETQPLAIERWKFYRLIGKELNLDLKEDTIGSVLGSNESVWLNQQNYKKIAFSTNMVNLARVLLNKRIVHALADEAAFQAALEQAEISQDNFHSSFIRYVPLVAYFSKGFITQNPEFLEKFNRYIDFCLGDSKRATKQEKQKLIELVRTYLGDEKRMSQIIKLIKEVTLKSDTEIHRRKQDIMWVEAQRKGRKTPLMTTLMSNRISEYLSDIRDGSEGKISEVFVFDRQGYILGLSQITSDYWQGDEEKYSSIFIENYETHFSKIHFDHSTRKFQVSITMPLHDPATGQKIAGITFGLDADIAISEYRVEALQR